MQKLSEGPMSLCGPGERLGLLPEERGKRRCLLPVMGDKSTIEIGESQESLHLLYRRGLRPIPYCFHLPLVHLHTGRGNDVAQEVDCGFMELTFFRFQVKAVLTEALEYSGNVATVFFYAG